MQEGAQPLLGVCVHLPAHLTAFEPEFRRLGRHPLHLGCHVSVIGAWFSAGGSAIPAIEYVPFPLVYDSAFVRRGVVEQFYVAVRYQRRFDDCRVGGSLTDHFTPRTRHDLRSHPDLNKNFPGDEARAENLHVPVRRREDASDGYLQIGHAGLLQSKRVPWWNGRSKSVRHEPVASRCMKTSYPLSMPSQSAKTPRPVSGCLAATRATWAAK